MLLTLTMTAVRSASIAQRANARAQCSRTQDVRVEEARRRVGARFEERNQREMRGVVDENVERAEMRHGRDELFALLGNADVDLHGQGGDPRLARDFVRRPIGRLDVPAGDDDVGAALGEASRDGAADAGAASGDDDDPLRELALGGGHEGSARVATFCFAAGSAPFAPAPALVMSCSEIDARRR